ncbi:MAG TPA: ABC transporter permease [Anaeromyxobacter sp.]|nr:ABC transporter permease [Anaeromyxobacter sp.]
MKVRNLLKHDNGPIFLTLVCTILAVFVVELLFVRGGDVSKVAFIKAMNVSNVLMQISLTGILATSMTLVMISGGIDLSVGQMMCFIGTAMAYMIKVVGLSNWSVVVFGLLLAVVFQVLMGLIISWTKLEPFIVSLGFMSMYKGFTYLITNGREITIEGKFTFLGKTYLNITESFRLGMPVITLVVLVIIMWLVSNYTKFGRSVYAVGGNESAAYLAGINVRSLKVKLYAVNGLFVAIATMASLSRMGTGNPLMGDGKEIDVIAAVVVGGTALSGGKGNVWGTFIGGLLLGCLSNALNILGVFPYWQYVLRGAIIILAVLLSFLSGRRAVATGRRLSGRGASEAKAAASPAT